MESESREKDNSRKDRSTRILTGAALVFAGTGGLYFAFRFTESLLELAAYVDVVGVASGLVVSTIALYILSPLFLLVGSWTLWKELSGGRATT